LFGGRRVPGDALFAIVLFNILIIASPCGEFADVAFGIAFGFEVAFFAGFLPFVVAFLGLAMIVSF
jgi:hypothetical protein